MHLYSFQPKTSRNTPIAGFIIHCLKNAWTCHDTRGSQEETAGPVIESGFQLNNCREGLRKQGAVRGKGISVTGFSLNLTGRAKQIEEKAVIGKAVAATHCV